MTPSSTSQSAVPFFVHPFRGRTVEQEPPSLRLFFSRQPVRSTGRLLSSNSAAFNVQDNG
jgi:hypothetical protein